MESFCCCSWEKDRFPALLANAAVAGRRPLSDDLGLAHPRLWRCLRPLAPQPIDEVHLGVKDCCDGTFKTVDAEGLAIAGSPLAA